MYKIKMKAIVTGKSRDNSFFDLELIVFYDFVKLLILQY